MKITDTPSRFIIDERPGRAALFIPAFILAWVYIGFKILGDGDMFGWFFIAATIVPVLFLGFIERDTLVLDADDRTMTITNRSIFRKRTQVFELKEVARAKTEYKGSGIEQEGQLQLDCGMAPIAFGAIRERSDARALAKQVNRWLDSHRRPA